MIAWRPYPDDPMRTAMLCDCGGDEFHTDAGLDGMAGSFDPDGPGVRCLKCGFVGHFLDEEHPWPKGTP